MRPRRLRRRRLRRPQQPQHAARRHARTVNGLFATKAAIGFAAQRHPSAGTILHGTSTGGFGAFNVGWSLEEQGAPPAGIIADSGVLNQAWELAQIDQGLCAQPGGEAALLAVQQRLHSALRPEANQPDRLVADGRLTVPIMQVWSRGDNGQCGETTDPHFPADFTPLIMDWVHDRLAAAPVAAR